MLTDLFDSIKYIYSYKIISSFSLWKNVKRYLQTTTMIKGGGMCDWYVFPGAKAPLI